MEKQVKTVMPTLFVSHGAPNLVLQDLPVRAFLKQLASFAPRPRAILVVSAHWLTDEPTLDVSPRPETIHDFYGFEPELYDMRYDVPGAPQLAEEIAETLLAAGFAPCTEMRGLDHGAWIPLVLAWPDARVPVTQLSLQPRRDAEHHYRLGLALSALRDDGVLVIGSGGATHNLGALGSGTQLPDWAARFDRWLA